MNFIKIIFLIASIIQLSSCNFIPKRPHQVLELNLSEQYINDDIKWVSIDQNIKTDPDWWKIYHDPQLDQLINKLNQQNFNLKIYFYRLEKANALLYQARSYYFPTITITPSLIRERSEASKNAYTTNNTRKLALNSSWEFDLWGKVSSQVSSAKAGLEIAEVNLANQKLSAQTSFTQYYYELLMAMLVQANLDKIVKLNQENMHYYQNQFASGLLNEIDLKNQENIIYTAKINAENNQIILKQYLDAMAILIGELPGKINLKQEAKNLFDQPNIPLFLPSLLVQRRPDIVAAEKQVEEANAAIGIAKAAFLPNFSFSSSLTLSGNSFGNLLLLPNLLWSVGPKVVQTIFDGNYNIGQEKYNEAFYQENIYSYKQTVISAFQEIEDQLAALNSLKKQIKAQELVVANSIIILNNELLKNKVGTSDLYSENNVKISLLNNKISLIKLQTLLRSAEIALIKAIGGGWQYEQKENK